METFAISSTVVLENKDSERKIKIQFNNNNNDDESCRYFAD